MKKKILSLTLVVCLLAIAVVGGTLAYFTDTENEVTNTFTVGNVQIKLDETDVDVYGDATGNGRLEEGNEYKLIPGHTYTKDPMVTVAAGSEPCYVRMLVKVNDVEALKTAFPTLVDQATDVFLLQELTKDEAGVMTWNPNWEYAGYNDGVYEFRYNAVVDARTGVQELPELFTDITVPAGTTGTALAELEDLGITVYAQAIQEDGFANAAAAFAELPTV